MQAVQRILDGIESHPFPDEHVQPGGHLTVSAGIASAPDDGTDPPTIIRSADVALYEAKRAGRDRVRA